MLVANTAPNALTLSPSCSKAFSSKMAFSALRMSKTTYLSVLKSNQVWVDNAAPNALILSATCSNTFSVKMAFSALRVLK